MEDNDDLKELMNLLAKIRHSYYYHDLKERMTIPMSADDHMKEVKKVESLKFAKAKLLDAVSDIDSIIAKQEAQTSVSSLIHARLYLIRREIAKKDSPPSWLELDQNGELWNKNNFFVENICRSTRDRNNKNENTERPNVKGWIPGRYTWQIWSYDPITGFWSILD